ncbi:MAG: FlgD immunoglobulin-like domain containing protein [Candidatus Zixiibacteriota bacterium]
MKKLILIFLLMIPAMLASKVMLPADDPSQSIGLPSTGVTDIEATDQAVWLGTGKGVSFLNFGESIWNTYDTSNGLIVNGISAMYAVGDVVYIALAKDSLEALYSYGLMRTFDGGLTWDSLSLDTAADSVLATNTTGWERIVFDIAGKDSVLFTVSKVSGLMGSFNYGDTWRPIYLHYIDSLEFVNPDSALPPYGQRYFSVAVDSTHNDSLILWAGTPIGLRRFTYAPEYSKISSNFIFDITTDGNLTFIAGDSGLTSVKFDTVYYNETAWLYIPHYRSYRMDSDNLPGNSVTTAYKYGDKLFVGTLTEVTRDLDNNIVYGDGTGIAVMADGETSFSSNFNGLDNLEGAYRFAKQFASNDNNLFIAGYEAGLFVSSDSGLNWSRLSCDTLDASDTQPRNTVYSLIVDSTNLFVGTDSGIVLIRFDGSGNDTLHEYIVFDDTDSTGARVYNMGIQRYMNDVVSTQVDSIFIWALLHPVDMAVGEYGVYYSKDYGASWIETIPYRATPVPFYDIAFKNNHAVLAGRDVLSVDAGTFWLKYDASNITENINGQIYNYNGLELFALHAVQDTFYVGSEHGFAELQIDGSYSIQNPHLFFATTDPQKHVGVSNYVYPDLTGNFVNVLEVQKRSSGQGMIWASTRPGATSDVTDHYIGVTSSTVDGRNWERYPGIEAWGFAFNGDTVFAATSDGLMMKLPDEIEWDTIQISGTLVSSIPNVDANIDATVDAFSADVIGDTLWVGTDDGAARIALSEIGFNTWSIYRESEIKGTFAYPVPFYHSEYATNGIKLRFNYEIDEPTNVTIEIYDFAMDLVYTVTRNDSRPAAGVYSDSDQWDGTNEKGDKVAVGIYYFKMSFSNGETRWGKLAILP